MVPEHSESSLEDVLIHYIRSTQMTPLKYMKWDQVISALIDGTSEYRMPPDDPKEMVVKIKLDFEKMRAPAKEAFKWTTFLANCTRVGIIIAIPFAVGHWSALYHIDFSVLTITGWLLWILGGGVAVGLWLAALMEYSKR